MMNFASPGNKFYFLFFFIPVLFVSYHVSAQADTTADNHCYGLCLQPSKVIFDTERILTEPGGIQKVFTPAIYSAEKKSIQLTPDDTFKIAQPKLYDVRKQSTSLSLPQFDSSSGTGQFTRNISVYDQIGLISVPDYIRRGISFPVTSFEMVSDSDDVLHTFKPVYQLKMMKHLEQNTGETARYEVLCPEKVTPDFIRMLCRALQARGYKTGNNTKIIDSDTNKALEQYEQDNNLPVGGLNLFTLQQLDIF